MSREPEYVMFPRDALFQFLGRMALPPWQKEDGQWIGGTINCAPIVQAIKDWVDANDLSSLYPLHTAARPRPSAAKNVHQHFMFDHSEPCTCRLCISPDGLLHHDCA